MSLQTEAISGLVPECIADAPQHLKTIGSVLVTDGNKLTKQASFLRWGHSHQVLHEAIPAIRVLVQEKYP